MSNLAYVSIKKAIDNSHEVYNRPMASDNPSLRNPLRKAPRVIAINPPIALEIPRLIRWQLNNPQMKRTPSVFDGVNNE